MITLEELKQILHYDSLTGKWTWLLTRSRGAKAGMEAGTINSAGQRIINIQGKLYRAHRLAWFYVNGVWPRGLIDHKNGNSLDNSIDNLREATFAQNSQNSKKPATNTSGYKGVYFSHHANKWRAQISVNGRTKNLGYFYTKEEAYAVYCAAANKYYGEFARYA